MVYILVDGWKSRNDNPSFILFRFYQSEERVYTQWGSGLYSAHDSKISGSFFVPHPDMFIFVTT